LKFAFLHHGDPFSESLWSGIPLNISRGLRELGHEVVPVGDLQPQGPFTARARTAFYRYLLKRLYLMNRDPRVVRLRAKDGNRRLKELGPVDAVLVTYLANAAYVETESPVVVIHDATWAQVLDYYDGYERTTLAAETVRGGMELEKKALDRCDHALYCSQWAASSAIKDFGLPPEKVSVAPLGASLVNGPTRADVAAYLGRRGQGPMKLFFVGKDWYRKGGDVAIRVAAEIERRGVPVELHIAGGEPEGELPSFVRRHGMLRKDVPEQAEELWRLFESNDFFILPTRAEAFGIVFAESAAYGLPVMASDTGGVREAVRGEWGITPPLGASPSVYADWAVKVFSDRAEYERLSWLARTSYEIDLNWPTFCRHLVQVVSGTKDSLTAGSRR
jgi:glycosyltransferase involved in cell wall biosynthesis